VIWLTFKKAMNSPMSRYENGTAGKSSPAATDAEPEHGRAASTVVWLKSSFCQSGECVEVGAVDGMVLMRDSKAPQAGTLRLSSEEFDAFVRGAVAGEFSSLIAR
jgi:hypothetical protein